jgi:hypothetical protein
LTWLRWDLKAPPISRQSADAAVEISYPQLLIAERIAGIYILVWKAFLAFLGIDQLVPIEEVPKEGALEETEDLLLRCRIYPCCRRCPRAVDSPDVVRISILDHDAVIATSE